MRQVKLFVGNLSWGVDDAQLREVFESYGTVHRARVILDRETGRSRGFAFVEMEVDDLNAVIDGTNGMAVNGRPIRVNEAEDRNRGGNSGGGSGGRRPPNRAPEHP